MFDFDGTLSLLRGGWLELMVDWMDGWLSRHARTGETAAQRRAVIARECAALNGRPTWMQMDWLRNELILRGAAAVRSTDDFAGEFQRALVAKSAWRCERVRSGECGVDDVLVPGARRFLIDCRRAGWTLALVSGTEMIYVAPESTFLGLDEFFEDRVFAPGPDVAKFTKAAVLDDLLSRHCLDGSQVIAFGDGPAEMVATRERGGIAMGIASDESARDGRMDAAKRDQLIAAGAHALLPDYAAPIEFWSAMIQSGAVPASFQPGRS